MESQILPYVFVLTFHSSKISWCPVLPIATLPLLCQCVFFNNLAFVFEGNLATSHHIHLNNNKQACLILEDCEIRKFCEVWLISLIEANKNV